MLHGESAPFLEHRLAPARLQQIVPKPYTGFGFPSAHRAPASDGALAQAGATPLHWACRRENLDMLGLLVSSGAEANAVDKVVQPPCDSGSVAPAVILGPSPLLWFRVDAQILS